MGRIIDEAQTSGFVAVLKDLTDKRRKTVVLTERGVEVLGDIVDGIVHVEDEFRKLLGARQFSQFKQCLAELNPKPNFLLNSQRSPTVLVKRGKAKKLVRVDDSPLTKLDVLLSLARLLDDANGSDALTSSLYAQSKAEERLMLSQQTVEALRVQQIPRDVLEAKLRKQLGASGLNSLRKHLQTLTKT